MGILEHTVEKDYIKRAIAIHQIQKSKSNHFDNQPLDNKFSRKYQRQL